MLEEKRLWQAKITRYDAMSGAIAQLAAAGDKESQQELLQLKTKRQYACEQITLLKDPKEQFIILTDALLQRKLAMESAESAVAACKSTLEGLVEIVRTCEMEVEKTEISLEAAIKRATPAGVQNIAGVTMNRETIGLLAGLQQQFANTHEVK